MQQYTYNTLFTEKTPELRGSWEGAVWLHVKPLAVDCFRPEGSNHRPRTFCKLLYNEQNIFGIFRVEDRYVSAIRTGFQSEVWKDSCVEFFVQPAKMDGYFNFEFNCGGALRASYVTDPTRLNGGLKECRPLLPEDDQQIQRHASLPAIVDPEIKTPVDWTLEFSIPLPVLKKYCGPLEAIRESTWRANFFKCGDETSHPHWASWTPLPARNFHDPHSFGRIRFCR